MSAVALSFRRSITGRSETTVATEAPRVPGSAPAPLAVDLSAVSPVQWLLGALLLGAGAIHLALAPSHLGESTVEGVGFVVAAWAQIACALWLLVRPTRAAAVATITLSVLLVAVWVVSRTAGLPFGAHSGHAEAVGFVDGVTVALELVTVLLAGVLALRPFGRVPVMPVAIVGVVAVLALTTAAIASPSARDHATSAHGVHDHSAPASVAVDHSAHTGAIHDHSSATPVALNGQHVHGVKAQDIAAEAQPDTPLDAPTRAKLQLQLLAARTVAMRYPTVADATAAGFHLAGGFTPGSGAHYVSYTGLTGPKDFDPALVNSLIYDGTNPTSKVIGLMYYGLGDTAPEGFAGPNDHWHRHSNVCLAFGASGIEVPYPADSDVTSAQCEKAGGTLMTQTGWMVHAWVVPSWESPAGVFSHDNPDVRCADGTYKTNRAGFCAGT